MTQPVLEQKVEKTEQQVKDKALTLAAKEAGAAFFRQAQFELAVEKYKEAISSCPQEEKRLCAILNCNIAICLNRLKNFKESIKFSSEAIHLDRDYAKAYYTRIATSQSLGELQDCMKDYDQLLTLEPSPKLAEERQRMRVRAEADLQKKKAEVLSGLKDMANGVLGWFGMSTDNFKVEQNQNGSYSIGMKR